MRCTSVFTRLYLLVFLFILFPALGFSDDVVHPGTPSIDRPTLTAIGVQLPVTGDDNYNATVTVRYRKTGTASWSIAEPLFRVHPETTAPYVIAPQFAGSIFDLRPATSYDLELTLKDPDGSVNKVVTLTSTTRGIPKDPVTPHPLSVDNTQSLNQALSAARAGDVIFLADGTYKGQFVISNSGTADNPIVIRGTSREGTIIDGEGCTGCNVIEVYGNYVTIERMTVRNGERAIRFQTVGAQGETVRRVHVANTQYGITGKWDQYDFYIADNLLEGRLSWPLIYTDDGGAHSDDDGINVSGWGHVVAHNRISGYGDAMKNSKEGARSVDFYGNDVLWSYDNGVELDAAEGNIRLMRNRFTNCFMPVSVQPIHGGPAYILRNIAVNNADEQLKFHGHLNPWTEPNGIFVYHNTFVSPYYALSLQTSAVSHHFAVENNIFIGPANPVEDMTVDWYGIIDDGKFDYNGYWPDKYFAYNFAAGRLKVWTFAELQKSGMETHGVLLNPQTLSIGLVGPASHTSLFAPQNAALSSSSAALDRAVGLPNINDGYQGSAPDLGALENGCPAPAFGPRPDGMDESNENLACGSGPATPVPAKLETVSGTPQAAAARGAFFPLSVRVLDTAARPLSGVSVTFTAPASGASGTFGLGGSATATVVSDASGMAIAQNFTANDVAGSYRVTASASGVAPVAFDLQNAAASAAGGTITKIIGPASLVYNTKDRAISIKATVVAGGVPVASGTVRFRKSGTLVCSVKLNSGLATCSVPVPGGTPTGTINIFARYLGDGDFAASSDTLAVSVTPASPVVTWASPASIKSGTALSSTQLNAVANVPGSFQYTPASGAVLKAGLQLLKVRFTPADATNYTPVSKNVYITVLP